MRNHTRRIPEARRGFGRVAHGGQMRIPFIANGFYAPNQGFFPPFAGGLYELESTDLIVSRGLCKNEIPRVFNPPEVVIIDILPVVI